MWFIDWTFVFCPTDKIQVRVPWHNKKNAAYAAYLFYGVDIVSIMEPNNNKILPYKNNIVNIYQDLISIMKESTNEYYNMRMVLGLKCV